jgi:hypothetical protein
MSVTPKTDLNPLAKSVLECCLAQGTLTTQNRVQTGSPPGQVLVGCLPCFVDSTEGKPATGVPGKEVD